MINSSDFGKKQILFVFFNEGEKLAFSNDNVVVKTAQGKIKIQVTCYRVFLIYAVGHTSITTVLLQNAAKFGFFIALMTPSFRLYGIIGARKDGNTMLKKKQYSYSGTSLAVHISKNKVMNQAAILKKVRNKSDAVKEAITYLEEVACRFDECKSLSEIMAYEGLSAKVYFRNHFDNILWNGRQPRLKRDIVNSVLDIGYTVLFAFTDAMLESFGFDVYCGVMHTRFYMRKSLVCDIVEPFRPLVDSRVKKAFNLKQIKEEDFVIINRQYRLKYQKSPEYVSFLMKPLIENRQGMFLYIQNYYRAFMKDLPADRFPVFTVE